MNKETLRFTLYAMSQPRTFYILGAGASFGLLPFTPQLRADIEDKYEQIGIYPTTPAPQSNLFDRVIGNRETEIDSPELKELLLRNIPYGTLELLTQRGLWLPLSGVIPPQYAVFEVVGCPSTIFSYNLDGLASAYCSGKHHVLEPHGAIDRYWIETPNYQEYLEYTAAFGGVLPHLIPKVLPSPEPAGITDTKPFSCARRLFAAAPVLIIIGYSFGQWNGQFDDWESLEYFIDLLRYRPKPVVILSPTPQELIEILQERLSSYNVYGLPIRWELFSATLLYMINPRVPMKPRWCSNQIEKLERIYDEAYDKRKTT